MPIDEPSPELCKRLHTAFVNHMLQLHEQAKEIGFTDKQSTLETVYMCGSFAVHMAHNVLNMSHSDFMSFYDALIKDEWKLEE